MLAWLHSGPVETDWPRVSPFLESPLPGALESRTVEDCQSGQTSSFEPLSALEQQRHPPVDGQ